MPTNLYGPYDNFDRKNRTKSDDLFLSDVTLHFYYYKTLFCQKKILPTCPKYAELGICHCVIEIEEKIVTSILQKLY